MFEMMLMGGRPSKIQYPNSGPGPKTLLFGDVQLGYFGELTSDAFLTVPELQRQLTFFDGNVIAPNTKWVKVYLEGKVLFLPRVAPVTDIPWYTLYNAGLVYGTDDNGVVPTATPTNQLRIVNVANRQLKVRLIKNSTTDLNQVVTWTDPTVQFSEWGKLATAMIVSTPAVEGLPKWKIYNNAVDLFMAGAYSNGQNSELTNPTVYQRRMTNTAVALGNKTGNLTWFPVLELIPVENEYTLSANPVYGSSNTTAHPVTTTDPSFIGPLSVQRADIHVELNPLTAIGITSVGYE